MFDFHKKVLSKYFLVTADFKRVEKNYRSVTAVADWVCTEIARYNKSAGKIVNPAVVDALKPYRPSGQIVLYRGLGIPKAKALAFLKKNKLKASVGSKGVYTTGKRQSWTSSLQEAINFAGLYSIAGRDPDSLGVVLKSTVSPEQIALPLGNLPKDLKSKCLHFDQDEYVLEPGSFSVEVVELYGDWSEASSTDLNALLRSVSKEIGETLKGRVGKTWNKQTGFAVDLVDYGSRDGKWSPSIQLFIDEDLKGYVEVFGPKVPSDAKKYRFKTNTVQELSSFLKNEAPKLVYDIFHKIKPWLEEGKKTNWG